MKVLFKIKFQSLQIIDCPEHYIGQDSFIQLKRGTNDSKTDKAKLDQTGLASFDASPKLEIKTTIKEGEAKDHTISAFVMSDG